MRMNKIYEKFILREQQMKRSKQTNKDIFKKRSEYKVLILLFIYLFSV